MRKKNNDTWKIGRDARCDARDGNREKRVFLFSFYMFSSLYGENVVRILLLLLVCIEKKRILLFLFVPLASKPFVRFFFVCISFEEDGMVVEILMSRDYRKDLMYLSSRYGKRKEVVVVRTKEEHWLSGWNAKKNSFCLLAFVGTAVGKVEVISFEIM